MPEFLLVAAENNRDVANLLHCCNSVFFQKRRDLIVGKYEYCNVAIFDALLLLIIFHDSV